MAETTLTAEQIAEAKRFLAAEAKEKSDATYRAIRAKLSAAAKAVAAEARKCPGVISAVENSAGFYSTSTGVEIHFAGEPEYKKQGHGAFLVLTMQGYTPDGEIKLTAKVKAGYKGKGVRTFKSVRTAVAKVYAFGKEIEASVAAWQAREAAAKAAAARQ